MTAYTKVFCVSVNIFLFIIQNLQKCNVLLSIVGIIHCHQDIKVTLLALLNIALFLLDYSAFKFIVSICG